MTKPGLLYTFNAKIKALFGYGVLCGKNMPRLFPFFGKRSSTTLEKQLNANLIGNPSNHNYRVLGRQLLPKFQLFERLQLITSLYPDRVESFLDIGCCRGFYVFNAADYPTCKSATGIDVYEPFVNISLKVKKHLRAPRVHFFLATLDEVFQNVKAYGGPFQTILLVGTYHYLFWGSSRCSHAFHSHREILLRLAKICSDRVILSARLEIDRLPRQIKAKAARMKKTYPYSAQHFVESAKEFFEIHQAGYLGRYPLLLMSKKSVLLNQPNQ